MIPYFGLFLSLIVIAIVVRLLLKDVFPQAILLIAGLGMILLSGFLEGPKHEAISTSAYPLFDIFEFIKKSFSEINAGVGLMIMAIGGFVAFIDKIGASEALVKVALKPLSFFKSYPNLAAVLVIPIGQLIFICVPSAAGMGLLMMAAVFPILVNLGVSRIAAVSIITGCTSFLYRSGFSNYCLRYTNCKNRYSALFYQYANSYCYYFKFYINDFLLFCEQAL